MVLFLKNGTPDPEVVPPDQISTMIWTCAAMAAYGWIFLALTLFLMKPVRTHKWWMGSFINICLGVSTCCLAPFCIPLAIKWNSKEVKDYFTKPSFDV